MVRHYPSLNRTWVFLSCSWPRLCWHRLRLIGGKMIGHKLPLWWYWARARSSTQISSYSLLSPQDFGREPVSMRFSRSSLQTFRTVPDAQSNRSLHQLEPPTVRVITVLSILAESLPSSLKTATNPRWRWPICRLWTIIRVRRTEANEHVHNLF